MTTSPSDLPPINKRTLKRVGIELRFENDVRSWMRRGWRELEAYLCVQDRFRRYIGDRVYEEDGA